MCLTLLGLLVALTGPAQPLPPPGDGDIRAVYWDVRNETEVWLTLEPKSDTGEAAPVVTFTHRFAGRRAAGPPTHVEVRAYAGAFWAPRTEFWLRVDDDAPIHLAPGATALIPGTPSDFASGAMDLAMLRQMAEAQRITGVALGYPFELTASQRRAIGDFVRRVLDGPE
jgi:hypothetical protein